MVNLVDAITRGIEARYTFLDPSFSEPITYRPITMWEHEMAHQKALSGCYDREIVKLIVGVGKKVGEEIELSAERYKELRMYQFNLMMWICYYGLKDFQPDNFSIEILKQTTINAPLLSKEILAATIGKQEEIVEVIKNSEGTRLAYIIHVLKIPLVEAAWKLTPLQMEYLVKTKRYLENPQPVGVQVTAEEMDSDPEKYKERLKAMFGGGRRGTGAKSLD